MHDTAALNYFLRDKDRPNKHAFISFLYLSSPFYVTNLVTPFFGNGLKRMSYNDSSYYMPLRFRSCQRSVTIIPLASSYSTTPFSMRKMGTNGGLGLSAAIVFTSRS